MSDFDKKGESLDDGSEREILDFLTALSRSPEITKKMSEGIIFHARMCGATKGILLLQLKDKLFIISRHNQTPIDGLIITEHIIAVKEESMTDIGLLVKTIKEESKLYF